MKLLVLLISIILMASCSGSSKKPADSEPANRVGKYVYIDLYLVTHTRLDCPYINYAGNVSGASSNEDGNKTNVKNGIRHGSGIDRVLLKDYDKEMLCNACKHCVDDKMYEYLQKYDTVDGSGDMFAADEGMAYTTAKSKRYHRTLNCNAIKRSTSEIEDISVEQAEEEGKTPCRICYKKK